MITALFLTAYLVIALVCVSIGLYLSEPGNTWSTLRYDVLNRLPRRSRPAPIESWTSMQPVPRDEQPASVDEQHSDAEQHQAPVVAPAGDESHEEAAPVEVVHDEP